MGGAENVLRVRELLVVLRLFKRSSTQSTGYPQAVRDRLAEQDQRIDTLQRAVGRLVIDVEAAQGLIETLRSQVRKQQGRETGGLRGNPQRDAPAGDKAAFRAYAREHGLLKAQRE